MSRTSGESIPKYRKHRGSGQAVVTICGQDFYLGPHGTKASRFEYDRRITEWLAGGRRGPSVPDQQAAISIVELIAHYLRHVRGHYVKNGKPTSEQSSIAWALRPLKDLYGRTLAVDFGPLALKAVRLKYIEAGYSRKSVNENSRRIRRMFKWAAAEEMIPATIAQALTMVSGLRSGRCNARETAPILPVDDKTLEATLPFLPAVVLDMVMLARYTGMRPAEVCTMRPCDVDMSGDVWLYRPESHKTEHHGRERIVAIGARAQGVLRNYLARGPKMYCFRPVDSEGKRLANRHAARTVPMSCGNKPGTNRKARPKRTAGERYEVASFRRAIHRACDKAGVPRWSPNQLRHAMATTVRKQFGLEGAQVALGHASANVSQIYAERDMTKAVEIARQIG